VGRDSPQKVEHMAVEPAGPRPLGKGWPVRLSAGSASACSAATGRAVGPAGAHRHASRYPDGSCRHRPASRANAHRRATEDGRAREAGGGGFGAGAARIQHRLLGGRLCRRGRSHPGGRRSVIGVEHFPARGRGGDVARSPSPPSSFGREHGRRVRRRASPVPPGLGRFARPEVVAPPGRWRTPATPRGGRDLGLGARASQGHRLVTRCGNLYPGMGTV
jgi:hypothetical protein